MHVRGRDGRVEPLGGVELITGHSDRADHAAMRADHAHYELLLTN
jgi:hypothetical protein